MIASDEKAVLAREIAADKYDQMRDRVMVHCPNCGEKFTEAGVDDSYRSAFQAGWDAAMEQASAQ